jgi:hypothetical protein
MYDVRYGGKADIAQGMAVEMSDAPTRWVGHADGPVQRIQILGSAVGDFFAIQIGAPQPAHGR